VQVECARQLCDGEAVAICAIDPSSTTVLLLPLETSVVGSPLCRRHTDGLRAPEGWQLRDERPARVDASLPVIESDAPTGPAQASEPESDPVPPVGAEPVGSDAASDAGSFESLLDARSPLLSRAFRTAGGD
jgi:hypothetical protein